MVVKRHAQRLDPTTTKDVVAAVPAAAGEGIITMRVAILPTLLQLLRGRRIRRNNRKNKAATIPTTTTTIKHRPPPPTIITNKMPIIMRGVHFRVVRIQVPCRTLGDCLVLLLLQPPLLLLPLPTMERVGMMQMVMEQRERMPVPIHRIPFVLVW